MQTRREFIKQTPALIGLLMGISSFVAANQGEKKRILLRSSWQTINIGDIAHTPGVIALLEKHLPDVEVRLWASDIRDGVEEMLKRRFPNLTIIKSSDTALLKTAFQECDFLLHGSGPYLVASNDVAKWHKETKKPFGVYGITLNEDKATPDVFEIGCACPRAVSGTPTISCIAFFIIARKSIAPLRPCAPPSKFSTFASFGRPPHTLLAPFSN